MNIMEKSENVMVDIELSELLGKVTEMKSRKYRIAQICCSDNDGKFFIYYSFGSKFGYKMETLKVCCDKDAKIPSVTTIYPYAYLYENEMKELFGMNIEKISVDYNNRLYRIEKEAPFRKEDK